MINKLTRKLLLKTSEERNKSGGVCIVYLNCKSTTFSELSREIENEFNRLDEKCFSCYFNDEYSADKAFNSCEENIELYGWCGVNQFLVSRNIKLIESMANTSGLPVFELSEFDVELLLKTRTA